MQQWCLLFLLSMLCSACAVAAPIATVDPVPTLAFDGQQALDIEREFVTTFTHRDSGQSNNRAAVDWLKRRYESLGLACQSDEWQIINSSRPLNLNNLICRLEGASGREIVIVAHHDQSPATVQGASNDGSGVASMLELARILGPDGRPRHALVFVSSDAEEYGLVGSRRLIATHPDPRHIVAAISLDNFGKSFYTGVELEAIGQFRGYAPLWM